MAKIKQMPDQLANQIAAGEVVERPASVVKELVENAIDAESTHITVELIEAGIQKITVIDDGVGMSPEDLRLATLPHATSKIYTVHDLFNIQTLGFRGEALASIGSVSHLTIESTTSDASEGYAILVEGSTLVEEKVTKPRKGTSITVEHLFYNTPARLKHLKTIQTELRQSINFIQNIALAHPDIRFELYHDGSRVFYSTGTGQLVQAIANVYTPAIARQLIPLQKESSDFKVDGYLSPPPLTRTTKQYIHWLVNQRPVKSYVLDKVLLKAYGRRLMVGRYPIAVLNITLDPHLVDVNVHPTKQTIRLSKEEELSVLITEMIEDALNQINPIPEVSTEDVIQPINPSVKPSPVPFDFTYSKTADESQPTDLRIEEEQPEKVQLNVESADSLLESDNRDELSASASDRNELNEEEMMELTPDPLQATNEERIDFRALRYVGQIHGTYLIAESSEGFYLIDQHAAQERIRYEQLMEETINVDDQQQLIFPIVLNFTAAEMTAIQTVMQDLERVGLHLSQFSPTSYQLTHYPTWLNHNTLEKEVRELVEAIIEEPNLTIQEYLEAGLIMQSCRGAIKANHYLDDNQAKALIQDMADLKDPYHCPHGRPVFVEFTEKTLEKLFKRIQDSHTTILYD